MNTCQTCRHFAALAQECRAKTPQAFVVPAPNGNPLAIGIFPAVRADTWCGEWAQPNNHRMLTQEPAHA